MKAQSGSSEVDMTDNKILACAQRQAELEAAKAAFFNSGGQITQADGYTFKPHLRADKIDPETVLKRRRKPPTSAERKTLQQLAEAS